MILVNIRLHVNVTNSFCRVINMWVVVVLLYMCYSFSLCVYLPNEMDRSNIAGLPLGPG